MQSVPSSFWEWSAALKSDERSLILFMCLVSVVAVIAILATTIYSMHKNRLADSLKRELLDRGMNADEIATIMNKSARKCGSQNSIRQ